MFWYEKLHDMYYFAEKPQFGLQLRYSSGLEEANNMLLHFGVANHLSICERQELSFAASSLTDRREGLIACEAVPSGSVLPAIVIYGANASGKTNLINAIFTMRKMVLWSHTKGEPGMGVPRNAFKLDSTCLQSPSKFDIDFIIDDVRYHYGFEATDEAFTAEWLYAFPKSYRRTIFERTDGDFSFGRSLKGLNHNIAELTRTDSLFLSAAAQNGHEQLSKVYGFFRSIGFAGSISVEGVDAAQQFIRDGLDLRVINFLKSINTGVIDYQKTETEVPEDMRALRRELNALLAKASGSSIQIGPVVDDKIVEIKLGHRGRDGEAVFFDLDLESAGTRRLLVVLSQAFNALDKGLPLCIDEIDASLHTYASEAVLKLFCSPNINRNGAQLIATTHDTNLMKSPVMRRDQLWFAEKGSEGATEMYPLSDIRTRKGDNIELGYLQGRYGALPSNNPESVLAEST